MHAAPGAPSALTRYLELIEEALREALPSVSPLADAARYAMGWDDPGVPSATRGKRIRPSLCLLAAECAGGEATDALPAAVAIELAHNFSLVHDDVQDRDTERHGRPTVWQRYGEGQAINVGDYLYTRAIAALASATIAPERRLAALEALLAALDRMLHGQWADIDFETSRAVSEQQYTAMVADKTGALLGASLQVGALLAGSDSVVATSLAAWGEDLGVAFQVWDDYLGIWGDPTATGKSNASDIARKKRSLPIILALADGGAAASRITSEYRRDMPDVDVVVEALESAGIRDAVMNTADERAARAIEAIDTLPITPTARGELAQVATFLVHRNH